MLRARNDRDNAQAIESSSLRHCGDPSKEVKKKGLPRCAIELVTTTMKLVPNTVAGQSRNDLVVAAAGGEEVTMAKIRRLLDHRKKIAKARSKTRFEASKGGK